MMQPSHLERRLAGPLPGFAAQGTMAPVYRQDPVMADVAGKTCREAAVLALIHPDRGRSAVLLIRRPHGLSNHAGQIAFPGGRREDDESLQDTALRETEEEVGVPAGSVRLLGSLTPLYVPPSRYCVYPFVGWVDELPPLRLQPDEVAEAFSAPLSAFTGPSTRQDLPVQIRGQAFRVPAFDVDGRSIWGATAMMLAELGAVLG